MANPIYLIDGSAYIFRAYYATPHLSNSSGFPTNALYGFTRMLLKFLRDAEPEHILMVFDAGKITFRNELYPEYKANRDECPADLAKQMPYFRDISRAFGLKTVELPGFEADDVIGTMVERLTSTDREVVIVSADKDLMQLVTDKVTMWDTMRGKRYGPAEVKEKLGVLPEQVIEFLAIAGDASDNIPGLKGAGPKTAIQLIENYGSVEDIIAAKDQIVEDKSIRSRKKIAERIESDEALFRLSKQLVTVRRDVPLELDAPLMEYLERQQPVAEAVDALVHELDFGSLVDEYGLNGAAEKKPAIEQNYSLILKKDFPKWSKQLLAQEIFAFDLETTSLNVHEAQIVGIAVCWSPDEAFYIPVAHKERAEEQLTLKEFLESVGERFTDSTVKKVGQNLKFDTEVLRTAGVTVRGVWFDTMLAAYLLHPDRGGYGLSALAKSMLSHTMIEFSDVVADGHTFADVPLKDALGYAAEDAHITWKIYELLEPQIKEHDLERVCYEIENPLVEVLAAIEHRGVKIDVEFLNAMSGQLAAQLEILEREIYSAADSEFNINSPKQLGEVMFERLNLPTAGVKKTKLGFSTNQAVLEKLRNLHPVPALILDYRSLFKLKSTYVDALPTSVSPITGRLHTRLNQTIAATGRLSSSEPNLQNIPIQTATGREVRKAFVPEKGNLLLSADYSQIELRLLAHLSGDEALINTFKAGVDIHEQTTREILGIPEGEAVRPEDRRLGKTINFGIVYGMSGFRLGRDLGIPVGEAQDYINRYFERYPKVHQYFEELGKAVEAGGEVRTLWGRRRLVSEIDQGSRDRSFVKRAALNAPIQGSAADLIKLAMLRVERTIEERQLPYKMILQIHDELLFEVPEGEGDAAIEIVRKEMEEVVELLVPLRAEVSVGKNWDEAH